MLMYIHIHNKYYFVISGSAPITGRMAIVTVNSLHCGVTYNITAGGMHNNGTLVGPGSSYKILLLVLVHWKQVRLHICMAIYTYICITVHT